MKKIVNILLLILIVFSTFVVSFAENDLGYIFTDVPPYSGEVASLNDFQGFDVSPVTGQKLPYPAQGYVMMYSMSLKYPVYYVYGSLSGHPIIVREKESYYLKMSDGSSFEMFYGNRKNENGYYYSYGSSPEKNPILYVPGNFAVSKKLLHVKGSYETEGLYQSEKEYLKDLGPAITPAADLMEMGNQVSSVILLIASSGVLILCLLILPILLKKLLKAFLNWRTL